MFVLKNEMDNRCYYIDSLKHAVALLENLIYTVNLNFNVHNKIGLKLERLLTIQKRILIGVNKRFQKFFKRI